MLRPARHRPGARRAARQPDGDVRALRARARGGLRGRTWPGTVHRPADRPRPRRRDRSEEPAPGRPRGGGAPAVRAADLDLAAMNESLAADGGVGPALLLS